jgi:tryptophan-rich sensory protein
MDAERIGTEKARLFTAGPVLLAATLGNLATIPNLAPWYAGLIKPALNPPNWVFGPVWTTLYVLMAYAAFRVLRTPPSPARRSALLAFFVQLGLNATWSFAFFAAHSPALGFVVISAMERAIVAAIGYFDPIDNSPRDCSCPTRLGWASSLISMQ